ncbi:hypothetical protein DRN63_05340 [Nanoarchaeota archaeon]|nr:MAG: hypothetical protein DRN63_05340 [Nanoarchaeota archaeon]
MESRAKTSPKIAFFMMFFPSSLINSSPVISFAEPQRIANPKTDGTRILRALTNSEISMNFLGWKSIKP